MSNGLPDTMPIAEKRVFRASVRGANLFRLASSDERAEHYVRDMLPSDWSIDAGDSEEDVAVLKAPFSLRHESLLCDGSFPVAYFCESKEAALQSLGQRIASMAPLHADGRIMRVPVTVIETTLNGVFVDISGEKEDDWLDPMDDWHNFGRTVRADREIDGILFSDEDDDECLNTWYAVFYPRCLSTKDVSVTTVALTVDEGEQASWEPA